MSCYNALYMLVILLHILPWTEMSGCGFDRFQRDGITFAVRHGGRALIADDMGLGKTVQVAFSYGPPCENTNMACISLCSKKESAS